jgi:hypothetical protein
VLLLVLAVVAVVMTVAELTVGLTLKQLLLLQGTRHSDIIITVFCMGPLLEQCVYKWLFT